MCQHHSPHTYSIHDNLVNWFTYSVIALIVNWAARQPELDHDYTFVWAAGALFGSLAMWALEIGHEWIKTWAVK